MRCHLPGPFTAQVFSQGTWRLSRQAPEFTEVFVRGASEAAGERPRASAVLELDIEWRGADAQLGVTSDGGRRCMQARSVIVHQPLARLYESLPLARFDRRARRFWRTVFVLLRIPGGRSLLGVLARHRG